MNHHDEMYTVVLQYRLFFLYIRIFPCIRKTIPYCFIFRTFNMTETATRTSSQQKPLGIITNQREKPSNGTVDTVSPKSPLEFTWTFWYIKPDKRLTWEQSLINLIDIGFVEDFWATFNHLASPSRLSQNKSNSDYYFFKKGGKIVVFLRI